MLLTLLVLTVMIFLPSFEHRPAVHLDAQPNQILGYLFIILVELTLLSGMYRMLARRLSGPAAAPS
jgi:hypothetical protein